MDPVTICNIALGLIGANRIHSLDAEEPESREEELCATLFNPIVKRVLEDKAWLFATGFYDLGAVAATPAGEAERVDLPDRRALPADTVMVRGCDDGSGDFTILWERTRGFVVSEATEHLYAIVTTFREADAWPPTFEMAVAFKLASLCAGPLANSAQMAVTYEEEYKREISMARVFDGMQGSNPRPLTVRSLSDRR